MSLIFKSYDPFQQKQRAERRRHAKPRERTELSASGPPDEERPSDSTPQCSAGEGDCSPIKESDIIRDPFASFPSEEECLSFCFPATDVSSASTPASVCSLSYKTDHFVSRWDSQDSAIDIQDDGPDSSTQTADLNMSDATPKAVLHRGDLGQTCELPISISDDASAQRASASELNNELLIQSAEALGVLASAAITEQESAVGISSAEMIPGLGAETISPKRPLPEGDVLGHDSEVYRSLKRSRRSDFNLHSSPRLESDDICPIPASPRVGRSVDQSSQVPEDVSPQFRPGFHVEPNLIAPDHPSSQSAELMSLPTEQAESVRLELLVIQKMISSLLAKLEHGQGQDTLPGRSVQRAPKTKDGTEGPAGDDSDDDSDDDSHSTSDNDSDGDSACDASEFTTVAPKGIKHRSTQRCRWTEKEENLLRRLKSTQKNVGMPSDPEIARKLNRSENGVKQHWGIMLQKERSVPTLPTSGTGQYRFTGR